MEYLKIVSADSMPTGCTGTIQWVCFYVGRVSSAYKCHDIRTSAIRPMHHEIQAFKIQASFNDDCAMSSLLCFLYLEFFTAHSD
jgi:hypothetical protein